MRTIRVETERAYDVFVGAGALALAVDHAQGRQKRAVLADETAWKLHGNGLNFGPQCPLLLLPPGEPAKETAVLHRCWEFLAASELTRDALLVAFGGGAALDVAGLSAALYMRGIDWIAVPTTLLAQVDAAIGGKTALNLRQGKNLVGAFHQPVGVYADPHCLTTLRTSDFRSGLGEVLKCALLGSMGLMELLESHAGALVARELELTGKVVAACASLKARLVAADPLDRGARRELNLGHTFAHAIEHVAGPGCVPHGLAVSVGLILALALAEEADILRDATLTERTRRLATSLDLPTSITQLAQLAGKPLPPEEILRAMDLDKKTLADGLRFVLPRELGQVERDAAVAPRRVLRVLQAACR